MADHSILGPSPIRDMCSLVGCDSPRRRFFSIPRRARDIWGFRITVVLPRSEWTHPSAQGGKRRCYRSGKTNCACRWYHWFGGEVWSVWTRRRNTLGEDRGERRVVARFNLVKIDSTRTSGHINRVGDIDFGYSTSALHRFVYTTNRLCLSTSSISSVGKWT